LYRNDRGTFVELRRAGVADLTDTRAAAWAISTVMARVDLYVGFTRRSRPSRLYRNVSAGGAVFHRRAPTMAVDAPVKPARLDRLRQRRRSRSVRCVS
jgi:hypothetical protein